MSSENFYKNLPATPIYAGLFDVAHHHDVPEDWAVVIVDIKGSTKAIAEGHYKDINIASSCAIVAVLNRVDRTKICYIFGGDGATFLIPSSMKFDVASALYGAQTMIQESFGLDMRAGMVDIPTLTVQNQPVRAAKIESRAGVYQAAISGSGIALAEKIVKDASATHEITSLYTIEELAKTPASFEGFECRWQPMKSRNGIDVSLLIIARSDDEQENVKLYREIYNHIAVICGHQDDWRPVSEQQMALTLNPSAFVKETKARQFGRDSWNKIKYASHIALMTLVGIVCMRLGLKAGSFDGETFRTEAALHTDYIKFENALKLVMDITRDRKNTLNAYLLDLYRQGKIFYGLQESDSAVMTCLVFSYDNDHFHFVDGADGGYTLAAKQLKAQMLEAAQTDSRQTR